MTVNHRAAPLRGWLLLPLVLLVAFLLALATQPAALAQGGAPADEIVCDGGMAGEYPCENVDFLSFMSIAELGGGADTEAANVWGWTDPESGTPYVILGMTDATAFVDVSDPLAPIYLGSLPSATGPADKYRDVKVYNDYAFIISDIPSEHGLQVFDLTELRDVTTPPVTFSASVHYDGFGNAHNIFINPESGFAYVMRITNPNLCSGAVYMLDVNNPLEPTFAGCYDEGGLASDTMCVMYHGDDHAYHGREICAVASDDNIVVADLTDKANPVTLADLTYSDIARAHNVWFSADHNYALSSDMDDEHHHGLDTRIFVWDLSDLDAPELIGIYTGPTAASDHNVWINGDYAYVGNFRAGVRILDITDIASGTLSQAAYFDMVPEDDDVGHVDGAWAVYPFFDEGLLAVSEKETGLWLLRHTTDATAVTLGELQGSRAPLGIGLALALLGTVGSVLLVRRATRRRA